MYGGYSSLFDAEFFGGPQTFVGLQNYRDMLDDPAFRHTIWVSAQYTFGAIVLNVGLGLLFAFALNRVSGGMRFVRAVIIAPYIVSNVAAAVMFRILFNADFGLLNQALGSVGLPQPAWLVDPNIAIYVVIFCQVWTDLPLTVLLLVGGLQAIDSAHLDSALVDGASGWKRARYVSIPLIAPQIMISVIWVSFQTLTSLGPGARTHRRRSQSLDRDDGHEDVHHRV